MHRFSVCSARALLSAATVAVALLAGATAAGAAPKRPADVPAAAVVVAGPTARGDVLYGWRDGRWLCLRPVHGGRDANGDFEPEDACVQRPVLTPFQLDDPSDDEDTIDAGTLVYGTTGTGIAAVERIGGAGPPVRTATQASPLDPDLRFYVLHDPSAVRQELRGLDADGVVRRAASTYDADLSIDTRAAHPVIRRGSFHGRPWTLRHSRRRRFDPTPLQPERWVSDDCVFLAPAQSAESSLCSDGAAPLAAYADAECDPFPLPLTVLARADVARVIAVLGDGTRRVVPLSAVPGSIAGLRGGGLVLAAGVAVRRLVATATDGRVLAVKPLLAPPALGDCRLIGQIQTLLKEPLGAWSLTPAGATLVAADRGPELCVGLGQLAADGSGCTVPPIDPFQSKATVVSAAGLSTLVGLVPAGVVLVRPRLDDGTTASVAPEPIPGYSGQYAGLVQAFTWTVPTGRLVVGYDLLDARGRVLTQASGPQQRPIADVRLLFRSPGLPPLFAGALHGAGPAGCLALGQPDAAGRPCPMPVLNGLISVQALCAPRRIVVAGMLARPTGPLRVVTAHGRAITARSARLPARLGGGTARFAVLPASAGLRLLAVGRHGPRYVLELPPARAQCGYRTTAWLSH